jgi:hypothetical protein
MFDFISISKRYRNEIKYVSFISYFCLLVFGILVTLVSFGFFGLAHLALQNVNKDYVIFLYFRNFVAKCDQKPKMKNWMNETLD